MKKNMYRFAAMDVIVNAITNEIDVRRGMINTNKEYYSGTEMPEYAQKENERNIGIIAELETFIDKL